MITTDPTELEQMKTLGELTEQARAILRDMEEADRAPIERTVHDYAGRTGYSAQFLHAFEVPHPTPTGVRARDVAPLLSGSGTELKYEHFSVVISKSRRLALYVACNIDGKRSQKIKRGRDRWSFDPRMDRRYQVGEDLYAGNELDRGHLVRREDPVWGQKDEAAIANDDTFHYTNCSPQHEKFNQQTWLGLEDYILQNSRAHKLRVTVFTGPIFRDDDPEYRGVRLPREYWKVVAVVSDGRNSATAYMISQSELLEQLRAFGFGRYKTYQVSIGQIERLANLDFGLLRQFDGFTTEEGRTRRAMRTEIRSWKDIRI
ncbi:MAG: DNA/RNA non-specific endonuclease [Nitrospiraceae bacterium]